MTDMLFAMLLAAQAGALPLPEHVDIPSEHSTVICPDQTAATKMIDQYYRVKPAPNNHTIDIEHFFEGLSATGCTQDGQRKGVVTIKSVKSRNKVELAGGPERILRYEGVDSTGKTMVGIVSEDGNNTFPRTDLARWLSLRGSDGWLDARDNFGSTIFYRCPSTQQARNVVSAVKGMEKAKDTTFRKKLHASAQQNGCRAASDRYMVKAVFESTGNECGFECYIDLTALGAVDRAGIEVGLVFDGSLM
jgi:hypothetical protein